jgi:hypothetical protein
LSEGQLVEWLLHPNELGARPDEIELMKKIEDGDRGRWLVYRFRMREPHWAAKDGWMAGVVGPVGPADDAEPLPEAPVVFSMFNAFDSASPEEHVAAVCKLMGKVGVSF